MEQILEYKSLIKSLKSDIEFLKSSYQIETLVKELELLNLKLQSGFDKEILQNYNLTKEKIDKIETIENLYDELESMIELSIEENDILFKDVIIASFKALNSVVKDTKAVLMFNGKYDENNALLSIHAGAGGKEAQDWAEMILRMYLRWADKKNFKAELIDYQEGESSGVCKSAVIEISGKNAYGLLKNENGIHRLVRVSPFDSQNRRHTSFAAVEVIPEITPDTEVNIDPKDIVVDTYRASGAGGQHVNKTESAIRITHIPTGIVVTCQNERSQHQNRDYAMKMLLSKLVQIKEEQHLNEISEIKGEQKQIQWGSQIRSYVFMPYQMVKDHRTNYETGNIEAVIDGDIDEFIYASLSS